MKKESEMSLFSEQARWISITHINLLELITQMPISRQFKIET